MRADFDSNCCQGKTSVVEFKETFINSLKTLVAYGERKVPKEELAMMFLLRLEMKRYGAMYTEMKNGMDKGLAFPTTVHQAYTISANRKECKLISGTSGNANSIAFADAGESFPVGGRGGRGRGLVEVEEATLCLSASVFVQTVSNKQQTKDRQLQQGKGVLGLSPCSRSQS
jgi:hypothetical protein